MSKEAFAERLASEWCYVNGLLGAPGTHDVNYLDSNDQVVFIRAPEIEDICTGDGAFGLSPLEMLADAAELDEVPQIVSVTTELDDVVTTWTTGDEVRIDHPGHADHNKTGAIVTFQVVLSRIKGANGQGMLHPVVHLGQRATLHVVPFNRLNKCEITL